MEKIQLQPEYSAAGTDSLLVVCAILLIARLKWCGIFLRVTATFF